MSAYRKEGNIEKPYGTANGIAMLLLVLGLIALEFFALVFLRNPPILVVNGIAIAFKEQRRTFFRDQLMRLGMKDAEGLASQLALLVDGAIAQALVRGDPAMARHARQAAVTLLAAAGTTRRKRRPR